MIKSPYDALGAPRNPTGTQTLEGEFQCFSCGELNDEAKYFPETQLLMWRCDNGHLNEVEEFEID